MKYIFYDTDITGNEEYDIADGEFEKLIEICCQYCKYVSFFVTNQDTAFLKDWEPYQICPMPNVLDLYGRYSPQMGEKEYPCVRYYAICAETKQLLLSMKMSMFQFIYGW